MDELKPPSRLCMDAENLSKTWKSWRDQFRLYLELTMSDAEEKTKVKLFYYLISESSLNCWKL